MVNRLTHIFLYSLFRIIRKLVLFQRLQNDFTETLRFKRTMFLLQIPFDQLSRGYSMRFLYGPIYDSDQTNKRIIISSYFKSVDEFARHQVKKTFKNIPMKKHSIKYNFLWKCFSTFRKILF